GENASLPVSRRFLPGPPVDYQGPFAGLRFPVGMLFRPSVYLVEIQAGEAVLRFPERQLAAGDVLAVETDRSTWMKNPRVLLGQLVVIGWRDGRDVHPLLASPDSISDGGLLFCEVFEFDEPDPDRPKNHAPPLHHAELPVDDVVGCCIVMF